MRWWWLLGLLPLAGCGRVWLPESLEIKVGRLAAKVLLTSLPVAHDQKWESRLQGLGGRIAAVSERPRFDYRFSVVVSTDANAFALPDGSVLVTTGLLEMTGSDEVALAGVLAHEIAHIARRHGAESLQNAVGYQAVAFLVFGFDDSLGRNTVDFAQDMLSMGYSRDMELEADLCAVRYLVRLGQPPQAGLRHLKLLAAREQKGGIGLMRYLATHPPTEDRIRAVESYIRAAGPPS